MYLYDSNIKNAENKKYLDQNKIILSKIILMSKYHRIYNRLKLFFPVSAANLNNNVTSGLTTHELWHQPDPSETQF